MIAESQMPAHPRGLLAATILASGVSFLDTTAVNVALPTIGRSLHAGLGDLQWIVDSYILTLAALMIVGGSLGDRIGRRRVFLTGQASFAVLSLVCAVAPSPSALIAARALQGVAGALLIPNSLALLRESFPPSRQAAAIGSWTGWSGITTLVGPLVAGALVTAGSWRLVFVLNLPLLAAAWFLTVRSVQPAPASGGSRLDRPAAVLVMAGLAGVTYGLIESSWPAVVAGVVALAALVAVELRAREPMIPPALFAIRNFAWGNASTIAVYAGLGGSFFLFTLLLQNLAGYSALDAGAANIPVNVCMLLLAGRFGRWSGRVGARPFMTAGPLLMAAAMVWLATFDAGLSYRYQVLPAMLLLGLGLALVVAPLTAATISAAPPEHAGVAAAVNTALARVGSLVAIAAVGAVVAAEFHVSGARPLQPPPAGALRAVALAASVHSYRAAMLLCAGLTMTGALAAAAGIRNNAGSSGTPDVYR